MRGPLPDDCKYHGYQNQDPNDLCYCELIWGTAHCFDSFENCCKGKKALNGMKDNEKSGTIQKQEDVIFNMLQKFAN